MTLTERIHAASWWSEWGWPVGMSSNGGITVFDLAKRLAGYLQNNKNPVARPLVVIPARRSYVGLDTSGSYPRPVHGALEFYCDDLLSGIVMRLESTRAALERCDVDLTGWTHPDHLSASDLLDSPARRAELACMMQQAVTVARDCEHPSQRYRYNRALVALEGFRPWDRESFDRAAEAVLEVCP